MIQQKLPEQMETHLAACVPDGITTFLLNGGKVRGSLLHGSRMINAMRANHQTGILESYILGHAYIAVGLLTAMIKGRDQISLSVECGGPVKGLSVETDAMGNVRGYIYQNPIPVEAPLEDFDVSPFFGPGFISVTRTLEGARQPVTGQTMMRHGSIAKDLANHFLESEQMPSLFFLSIQFDARGDITGAGGLFLQGMPGADDRLLDRVEEAACSMPSIGQWFAGGSDARELIRTAFAPFSPEFIGVRDVGFLCPCERSRFLKFLASLNTETRESILEEGPFPLELVCHKCGTTYAFPRDEVAAAFG